MSMAIDVIKYQRFLQQASISMKIVDFSYAIKTKWPLMDRKHHFLLIGHIFDIILFILRLIFTLYLSIYLTK